MNPNAVVTQVVETIDPDLQKICVMTGLSMDKLVQKVNGLKAPTVVGQTIQPSNPKPANQRENHLELSFGLLDDYSDVPGYSELNSHTPDFDIKSHWFDDCTSLREPRPRCNVCSGYHGSEPCPLLGKVRNNHVSVCNEPAENEEDADLSIDNDSSNDPPVENEVDSPEKWLSGVTNGSTLQ